MKWDRKEDKRNEENRCVNCEYSMQMGDMVVCNKKGNEFYAMAVNEVIRSPYYQNTKQVDCC